VADNPELAGMLDAALTVSHLMAFRERTKTTIVKVIHEARMAFRELGRRHSQSGDISDAGHVFMLLESELDDFISDPASFRDTLAERAEEHAKRWEYEPPFIIRDATMPPLSEWDRRDGEDDAVLLGAGEDLTGVSGSPGTARGTARVVMDPRDPGALEPGDVLVAPFTDPSWTPLFMTAGAVVVDVGSPLSHAVIVSRELGLPCVVSATGGTSRIPDGATVEVDGSTGVVSVVDTP
jgi:phosphohistidine swiveling domain-containing protein